MPSAPKFQAPQGTPLHSVQFRAISESLAGNGVLNATDLEVTATATDLEIEVAAGTYFYVATEHTLSNAETHTLSAGDGTYDRWDTVYFDTATQSSGVRDGTAEQNPSPPDIQGDEALLAIISVPSEATDVADSDILNWRAQFSNEAEETHYDDSTGEYGVNQVDAALNELQEAAQISAHPLANSDLANSTVEVAGGNGLSTTSANIALGGSATLAIKVDAISTDELDLSIAPTWTGAHTYDTRQQWQEIATPSNPSAGYWGVYIKSDGLMYKLDENGNEQTVGAVALENGDTEVVAAMSTLAAGDGLSASDQGSGEGRLNYDHQQVFEGRETGTVTAGNQGVLVADHLPDGDTVEVYKAVLIKSDGMAIGSNTTLELVMLDNSGGFDSRATLISGDGSTIHDSETGNPLGSYENTSGGGQTIGVLVNNQESSAIDIVAVAEGVTGL